jgi:hypothetical protein
MAHTVAVVIEAICGTAILIYLRTRALRAGK